MSSRTNILYSQVVVDGTQNIFSLKHENTRQAPEGLKVRVTASNVDDLRKAMLVSVFLALECMLP